MRLQHINSVLLLGCLSAWMSTHFTWLDLQHAESPHPFAVARAIARSMPYPAGLVSGCAFIACLVQLMENSEFFFVPRVWPLIAALVALGVNLHSSARLISSEAGVIGIGALLSLLATVIAAACLVLTPFVSRDVPSNDE